MLVEGRHVTEEIEGFRSHGKTPKSGGGKSSRRSSRKSARKSAQSSKSREISVVGSQPRVGDNTGATSATPLLDEGVKDTAKKEGLADEMKIIAEISNTESGAKDPASHISDSVSQSQKESGPQPPQSNEDGDTTKLTSQLLQNETEKKEVNESETKTVTSDNVKEKESVDSLLDLDDMLEELNLDKIDEQVGRGLVTVWKVEVLIAPDYSLVETCTYKL